MFADLPSFLRALASENQLVEIEAPVNPVLELPEIHRRVIAAGGPALLFRQVEGSNFPLVTNLFGTRKRVDLAFGNRPLRFLEQLIELVTRAHPPGPGDLWGARNLIAEGLSVGIERCRSGPVTQVVHGQPDLDTVPFLQGWPEDGGSFLTLPLVYTEHPEDGRHNLGMYRIQRYASRTTGIHWQIGKGGGFHHALAERRGESLPAVIHLGGPPAMILAAIAPLPENVPELLLASLLAGGKIPLAESPVRDFPLPVVASSEMALLGFVPPGERRPEGPFGDHYGYYSLEHDFPVFHCRALAHRQDAVIPATVVGKPRQEDFFIGDYLQELLSPLFPLVMPAVKALWSYGETGFHSLAGAVVRERYQREALASAFRILGEGQLSLTKFLLLTDGDVDLQDFPATLSHILARTRFERDLYLFDETSMDTLDYAGGTLNRGSKGILMGLGEPCRELRTSFQGNLPRGVEQAEVFCPGCLVVEGPSYGEEEGFPQILAGSEALEGFPLVILTDREQRATASAQRFLWVAFTRFNPATDLHPASQEVRRHHLSYQAPVVLDARMKPWYPGEVLCDDETRETVARRWQEYFPAGDVEAGETE
jgi:UbiD family decarboxylase